MTTIIRLIERYNRWRAIRTLRSTFAFFGHDLSHLSDEEIIKGVYDFSILFAGTGITADEAAIALLELACVDEQPGGEGE